MSIKKKKFDCKKCTAYCCSYTRIAVNEEDIKRLAKFFDISKKKARVKFTKQYKHEEDKKIINEIILRHKKDHIFKSVCRFLNKETRGCSIYDARPQVCREYPDSIRCGYYEFLKFERRQQEDESFIPDF